MRQHRWLAALVALFFVLLLAAPVFAAGKSGGFSSGRSSGGFSSGSSSRSGFSSGTSRSFSGSTGSKSVTPSAPSSGSKSSGGFSSGSSRSYSTPSTSSSKNFTVGRSFSSGSGSYSSGSGSYSSGSGYSGVNGAPSSGTARSFNSTPSSTYPSVLGQGSAGTPYYGRPPVVIYSPLPLPYGPDYYHGWYWGSPWYWRVFFTPTYYYTPWGYHYFEPNYATWVFAFTGIVLVGAVGWGWWRMRRW